jgi:hypothetical protein
MSHRVDEVELAEPLSFDTGEPFQRFALSFRSKAAYLSLVSAFDVVDISAGFRRNRALPLFEAIGFGFDRCPSRCVGLEPGRWRRGPLCQAQVVHKGMKFPS